MSTDKFYIKWDNYLLNMLSELDSLRTSEDLVDVTLSCGGQLFKAHKVVLSMCSSYFRNVFKNNPCKHPVVILKDVNQDDIKALLKFVYQGTVYVSEKKLSSFLRTAELLQIKGLAGTESNINPDLESTQTSLEKNSLSALQQLSTNNNKVEKQDTSTSTVKPNNLPDFPIGSNSAKRKKCFPDIHTSTSSCINFGIASTSKSQCTSDQSLATAGIPQVRENCTVCDVSSNNLYEKEEYPYITLNEDQKQVGPQDTRKLSIRQCILPFVHHCQCKDPNCRSSTCQRVKRIIQHVKLCKIKCYGTCPLCKRYVVLCFHHSKYCTQFKCPILFCSEIKDKIKQQQQQEVQLLRRQTAFINTGTLVTENTAFVGAAPQHNMPIQSKMIPHKAPVMVPNTQLQSSNDAATITAAETITSLTAKVYEPTSTTNDNQ
ncbi:BTB/POZ domain,SKP1/BTB/POZ domain,Zinc finger, TAZ-type [Cinara cedri]|uniref:BTB/POZ domain,SKP1/BTB/POZ domain,Zinc finger, TAZ-type n=1 Tax=Cinara cedri TaxID=506608 RepID=A0A5E4N6S0_9HEMI|nr:BTB/POZ domain,SKP1/BTB/POZ domain,Zinc finger, TAZ-type [Cinara cedri]